MKGNGYPLVSGSVFGVLAVAHAIRALMQVPAQLGTQQVPLLFSWVVVVVAGILCIWAFRSVRH